MAILMSLDFASRPLNNPHPIYASGFHVNPESGVTAPAAVGTPGQPDDGVHPDCFTYIARFVHAIVRGQTGLRLSATPEYGAVCAGIGCDCSSRAVAVPQPRF
jgi:hypothetical protein